MKPMYILAVDDERTALDSLVSELKKVFHGGKIQSERQPSAAVAWSKGLADCGDLRYAFL